ncbi:MAG: alkaline phosphatase D family protein [Acidimicrobiales bacterium]
MQRRTFLSLAAVGAATACTGGGNSDSAVTTSVSPAPTTGAPTTEPTGPAETAATTTTIPFQAGIGAAPFGLGVASGDPSTDGFVIWTRLVDGSAGNPVFSGPVEVSWWVATEPGAAAVASGTTITDETLGHSVHVVAEGLSPDTVYFYGFDVGGVASPMGRSRTSPTSAASTRVAFASCQHYEDGYFTAWDHIVEDQPDMAIVLGDMIYTRSGTEPKVREHGTSTPGDLTAFRRRWALYTAEEPLQRARASMPVCAVWDDNEVLSNYSADSPSGAQPTAEFAALRQAAYRAWWEHQPVRTGPPDESGALQIYRKLDWGDLATLWLLDERQYRSAQVCERLEALPAIEACEAIDDPSRTMLGQAQEEWLDEGISGSRAVWQLLASQTVVADWLIEVGDIAGLNNDQWDGYSPARDRLLATLSKADRALIVSGDVHLGAVNMVRGPNDTAFTELVTPSISSALDDRLALGLELTVAASDDVAYFETRHHGYVLVDITPGLATATFRHVDPASPSSPAANGPIVEANGRGALAVTR